MILTSDYFCIKIMKENTRHLCQKKKITQKNTFLNQKNIKRMKQKLLLIGLICTNMQILLAQNGTRPDEAKVILESKVIRTINVTSNDNAVPGKTYEIFDVYKTTSNNIVIDVVAPNVTYQDNHGGAQNDTFYYIAREVNSGTFDTNYVVIKKDALSYDLRPGDANRDNICNNIDVLNIGIAYGKSEIAREGIFLTDNWTLVKSYDWSLTNLKSNYRFSDANGDGTIDSTGDINTIFKNYNQRTGLVNVHYSPTGGQNFQIVASDTVKVDGTNDKLSISINLGSTSSKIRNAYGLSFTLKFDPLQIPASKISFKPSKWFIDNGATLNFSSINSVTGEIDITIVRKSGLGSDAEGELGVVDVVELDDLGGLIDGINTNFEIIKPVLIDSVYNVLPVTLPAPKPVHIVKKLSSSIRAVQPNSGLRHSLQNTILSLKNESIQPIEVSIVNILGKEISKKRLTPNQLIETDISTWSSGIYFLRTSHEAHKIHVK